MTMKERIENINKVAQSDFNKAQGMLEMLNELCGTRYGWLAKRVVRFDDPDASTCFKYAHAHDAWAEL